MKNLFLLLTASIATACVAVTRSPGAVAEMNRDPRYIKTFRKLQRAKGFDAESVRKRYANLHLDK